MSEVLEKEIQRLQKRLEREKKARLALEKIIEDKSRNLFLSYEFTKKVLASVDNLIITTDEELLILDFNESWGREVSSKIHGKYFHDIFLLIKTSDDLRDKILRDGYYEGELTLNVGESIPVYVKGKKIISDAGENFVFSVVDLRKMKEMEAERHELQERLIKSAYSDGVAESAISVLHNIGNILTALTSRTSAKSELAGLRKVKSVLEVLSNKWNDLPEEKVSKTFSVLENSFSDTLVEVDNLYQFVSTKCSHIANIIASQQRYANLKESIRTKTNLKSVLDDCLEMVGDRLKKRNIKVLIIDESPPLVMAEKVGLSQVLLNVLVNATESIDDQIKAGIVDGHSITINFMEGHDFLIMSATDTGTGVEKEKLKELFNFGFSTKERGSGFGLHNCANYMKNNNGKISIESDGVGHGATVILSFEKVA